MKAHRKIFAVSLLLPASLLFAACSREDASSDGLDEAGTAVAAAAVNIAPEATGISNAAITEAPTGFDNLTNGVSTQADMDAAKDVFGN